MKAYLGEKLDTQAGKRNLGAPINRCAIRDLERSAGCLSRVRGDSPARFFGEGVIVISPPYPTTYLRHCQRTLETTRHELPLEASHDLRLRLRTMVRYLKHAHYSLLRVQEENLHLAAGDPS